jgi:hypothetical protein
VAETVARKERSVRRAGGAPGPVHLEVPAREDRLEPAGPGDVERHARKVPVEDQTEFPEGPDHLDVQGAGPIAMRSLCRTQARATRRSCCRPPMDRTANPSWTSGLGCWRRPSASTVPLPTVSCRLIRCSTAGWGRPSVPGRCPEVAVAGDREEAARLARAPVWSSPRRASWDGSRTWLSQARQRHDAFATCSCRSSPGRPESGRRPVRTGRCTRWLPPVLGTRNGRASRARRGRRPQRS